MLVKRTGARGRKKHFFLFNDILVWGSIIRENINCIRYDLKKKASNNKLRILWRSFLLHRQRIVQIEEISVEDIEDSNMWTITTPGALFAP